MLFRSELWDHSLVDPDNRRPVDFALRSRLAADLGTTAENGTVSAVDGSGAAKFLVTREALRLRRDRPELFTGYTALSVRGPASGNFFGFDRGGALTLVTRLPLRLETSGGWNETAIQLPAGRFRDRLTGTVYSGGELAAADAFKHYPVALLAREEKP